VKSFLALAFIILAGCASLTGTRDQYLVCPYDTVWEAAVDTMKARPLSVQDKVSGVIETPWTEMAAEGRPYGMFGRDPWNNRERARMIVTVKHLHDVTSVTIVENRQRWHNKGGVTQEATKWWPVEPSQEAIAAVQERLDANLKKRDCPQT
jgi:hypothetical protein